jgi:3-phenylpropionate/cinnamic acid dioxygenase small subunit
VLDAIDIVLIHQLIGRYGYLIDHRQWDRFADLFLPDATIDYRSSTGRVERSGREAIVAWFSELEDSHPPAHHVTNILVDERADPAGRVDVDSKFLAPYTRPNHAEKRLYGGEYHDVVVKTADGWRFAHKQCIPSWQLTVVTDDTAPDHRHTSSRPARPTGYSIRTGWSPLQPFAASATIA